jgi:hypothetical protein
MAALTIALNAALLFAIQPMIAKTLLPRFGGSAGVWVTSMMFFQLALLLGYLYSFCVTRYAGPTLRTIIHIGLLAASLTVLPLRPITGGPGGGHPIVAIVVTLARSVGLPFLLLSTTNSLVQSWYAASRKPQLAYRLFALSNAACLIALLAYPLVIEPLSPTTTQLRAWSAVYAVIVLLVAIGALRNRRWRPEEEIADIPAENSPLLWIALSATASTLWLSIANHLSQEVAAVPFLWVLPLTIYLLSFAIAFGPGEWYRPRLFRWLLPAAWLAIVSRIGLASATPDIRLDLPLMLAALLILCVFCHGELARSTPALRQDLPFFYLMTATGGALGGIFVAVIAPSIFTNYLELPIAVVMTAFLAMMLAYGVRSRTRLLRLSLVAVLAFVVASKLQNGDEEIAASRNFYGAMRIRDRGGVRTLFNGRTVHGIQFLTPPSRSQSPTGYYGRQSGVGRLLDTPDTGRRVALVGLGAGTLAAYGHKGDSFRFYEINPAVVEAASTRFRFLADSAAVTDVIPGDGRLQLQHEPAHSFDVIVLDAFSDDAIPVHLLTREAFQLYSTLLRDSGTIAIHISNRYLDLYPVVLSLAHASGKSAIHISSPADPSQQTLVADWAIVGDDKSLDRLRRYADEALVLPGPLWTDEYSNLLQIWR